MCVCVCVCVCVRVCVRVRVDLWYKNDYRIPCVKTVWSNNSHCCDVKVFSYWLLLQVVDQEFGNVLMLSHLMSIFITQINILKEYFFLTLHNDALQAPTSKTFSHICDPYLLITEHDSYYCN